MGIELVVTLATQPVIPQLPNVALQPQSQVVNAGLGFTLSPTVSGGSTYQWMKNGAPLPGATTSTLTVTRAQVADAGSYVLLATNSIGTVATQPASISIIQPRLANVSVRSIAGTGDQALIVGFVISGTGQKQTLLRGIGPTLAQFAVNGPLVDPLLRLHHASGAVLNQNAIWGGSATLAQAFASVGAFPLAAASRDTAIYSTLPSGAYTAQVSGTSPGVALLECYDSDPGGVLLPAHIVNLSARNQVGTGDNILVAGFVISGFTAKSLLVRGIGPSLAQFNVTGVLANPRIQLFRDGTLLTENDNWGGGASLSATFTQVGAFPLAGNSSDAALLAILQPGTYTAQMSGVGGTTGVGLIEIYEVP